MNIGAILAGGKGLRMGGSVPKQFLDIGGKPILVHTIEKFQRHPEIDEICVVCPVEHCDFIWELVNQHGLNKVKYVIPGGRERQESSLVATEAMYHQHEPDDILLIHDGARPNVDERIISENIKMASNIGACNTVIPSQDTILTSKDGKMVSGYTNRSEMYLVQTPQSFKLKVIYDAHIKSVEKPGITDDCSLVYLCGGEVGLVEGSKANVKVTTPEDLQLVKY
ncbi:MAG: 2-C-methyl-D-erythritol 4-phosphate cytidylyltransferase [Ruminococcaceae bacterium]|nr:2-C-methyl-D-erythritol 4-phosphate cytidylyltransferase [Oscillospiraceae bacterium]